MGLLLHLGSFGVAYAGASDVFNAVSVYWLHHYDPKWTPEANVSIFRDVLPLFVAVACLSCFFGARSILSSPGVRIRSAIVTGAISGVLAAIVLLAPELVVRRDWPVLGTAAVFFGRAAFLFGPAVICSVVIRAARRRPRFSA